MRRLIAETFPAHGVIGEEYGRDRPEAEYVWVLDPIDGTKSFVSGLPTWGTLIGLMYHGRPVYGTMAQPFTRERFYGDAKRASIRTLAPSRGEAPPSEWAIRSCIRAHARRSRKRPLRRRARCLFPTTPIGRLIRGRGPGPARSLRRRLLRLLRARGWLCRSRDRDQPQTSRHCRARSDHRGRGRRGSTWEGERRPWRPDYRRRRQSRLR